VRNGIASSFNFFRLRQKSSHDPLGARPSVGAYIQRDIHQPLIPDHDAMWGPVRPGISMLFWLPLIFLHAIFEMDFSPTKSSPKPAWFEQPNDKVEIC
jgi:hypothetical protein